MPRIIALLLLCLATLTAGAADYQSDVHHFAITIPDSESWMQGNVQPLGRDAEIVFSSINMDSREGVIVAKLPKIPTNDITNQAVISRIIELLTLQGFTVLSNGPRTVNGVNYREFIGRRTDENNGKVVSVSRAIMKDNTALITTFFARGDEDRALDPSFLRVLNTFRLLSDQRVIASPLVDPMHGYYRMTYITCLAAAGGLLLLFIVVMITTRKKMFE